MTIRAQFRKTSAYVPNDKESFLQFYCAKYKKTQGEAFEDAIELLQKVENGENVAKFYLNDLREMLEELFQRFSKFFHNVVFSAFYTALKDRYAKTDELDLTNLLLLAEIKSDMTGEPVNTIITKYRGQAKKLLENQEQKKPKERL